MNDQLNDHGNDDTSGANGGEYLSLLINVFVAPNETFKQLQLKPSILFPLLLVMAAQVILFVWYYSTVDFPWLVDQLLARMGDIPADQVQGVRDAYTTMGSKGMMASTVVSVVVMMLVIYSLQAGYLALVSALSGNAIRFKQWFSLVCWTSMPALLVVIVSMVNIALSENGQIGIYDLNSLSLRNLGVNPGDNTSLGALLDSISIAMFWNLALLVAGYEAWLKSGWGKAAFIILTPQVVIFGVWAAVALS